MYLRYEFELYPWQGAVIIHHFMKICYTIKKVHLEATKIQKLNNFNIIIVSF